jgi:hypothetical protein
MIIICPAEVLLVALFVPEVAEVLKVSAREIALQDPFTTATTRGETALRLIEAAERSLERPPVPTARFETEGAAATLWTGEVQGRILYGCTAALVLPQGGAEVRITLRSLPVTTLWRDRVRGAAAGLVPEEAWELPAGTDLSLPRPDPQEVLDAHLPFPLAPEAAFHSPILARSVYGAALVEEVIAHASATYGARSIGARMLAGPEALFLWTGGVSGVPMEVATWMRIEQGHIAELSVYMQPWPAVRLFHDRMRVRTTGLLSPDYFGSP